MSKLKTPKEQAEYEDTCATIMAQIVKDGALRPIIKAAEGVVRGQFDGSKETNELAVIAALHEALADRYVTLLIANKRPGAFENAKDTAHFVSMLEMLYRTQREAGDETFKRALISRIDEIDSIEDI